MVQQSYELLENNLKESESAGSSKQLSRIHISIGFVLCLSIAVSAYWPGAEYLNPITISLHIVAYLYWAFVVYRLHRMIHDRDGGYPFGARESAVGALIPFSYIFWNFVWVHKAIGWVDNRRPGTRLRSLLLAVLVAGASTVCFPDNMDKLPGHVLVAGFLLLFSLAALIKQSIETADIKRFSID